MENIDFYFSDMTLFHSGILLLFQEICKTIFLPLGALKKPAF